MIWFANLTFSFSLDDPATLVPTLVALLAGTVLVLFVANIVRKVFFPLGIRAGLQEGGGPEGLGPGESHAGGGEEPDVLHNRPDASLADQLDPRLEPPGVVPAGL